MRPPRPRSSATPSDGDDHPKRRQPFRPLQSARTSRSPLPTKSTPPREVILTPRATPKPLKRRVSSRPKRAAAKVKSEPPEIDVSKVRPPSPSDDPLLLSGSRPTRTSPLRARFTPAFSSSPSGSTCADPPVSFAARLSGTRVGGLESSPDTDTLPIFNIPRTVEETSGVWSDSDDDGFNLTGEYTGKYKILKVPTKADPSTSETRERMEPWGRPVSPFPYSEIMERSLPLSDFLEECSGQHIHDLAIPLEDADMWEVATEPPLSDVEATPPPVSEDEFAELDRDLPLFDVVAESTQIFSPPEPQEGVLDSDHTVLEEEEEEAQVDRELSVAIDDGWNVPAILAEAALSSSRVEDDSSDEGEDVEEDIIKITSGDPKAAARAAAILRMHDYDCILAAEKKRSSQSAKSTRKRRKTIENAGISKSYMDLRSQRWQTLQSVKTSPGSRSLPLLELWRDAEDSIFLEHNSTSFFPSFSLSPLKAIATRTEPLPSPTGEWTRDCWKCLDKCLTAERLAVAAARGLGGDVFADLGDVSKDAVLDRFMSQLDTGFVPGSLGPDWSRDNLVLRLDVLIKKQSRLAPRAPPVRHRGSLNTAKPCYSALLHEAMMLSAPLERCPTSTSTSSDTTVVPEPRDACKASPDLSWQINCSRGPVWTPSRSPDPVPAHPKDRVHLRHTSPQKSMIPVPIKPKRLVDLRHLSPTKADGSVWRSTPRLSSGNSVRDLVRQYESLDQ